jgi:hypothetical protein
MTKEEALPVKQLMEILDCNLETGVCYWRRQMGQRGKIGSVAGSRRKQDGYVLIQIFGRKYLLHRIVWAFATGSWPTMDVDHRDGNSAHNSFRNLRLASDAQNSQNGPLRVNNRTGLKWVSRRPNGMYQAIVSAYGEAFYLGVFFTKEEAHKVAARAASALHKDFRRVA